jgi:hypothetical protein
MLDDTDPLVFDLSPGGNSPVSLLEMPLIPKEKPPLRALVVWESSILEMAPTRIAAYALAPAGADAGAAFTVPNRPRILIRRAEQRGVRGRSPTDLWAVLTVPDGLYALADDAAFRIDAKTLGCERIGSDPELYRIGRIRCFGVSERRGPLMWGDEFCRVVVAREPPAGALEVKTVVGAEGEIRILWTGQGPTPSGQGLMQHDVRQ